jgi:hypothetical protein
MQNGAGMKKEWYNTYHILEEIVRSEQPEMQKL